LAARIPLVPPPLTSLSLSLSSPSRIGGKVRQKLQVQEVPVKRKEFKELKGHLVKHLTGYAKKDSENVWSAADSLKVRLLPIAPFLLCAAKF